MLIFILTYFYKQRHDGFIKAFTDKFGNSFRLVEATFIFSYFGERHKCYCIEFIGNAIILYCTAEGFGIAFCVERDTLEFEINHRISYFRLIGERCNTPNADRGHDIFRHFWHSFKALPTFRHIGSYDCFAVGALIGKKCRHHKINEFTFHGLIFYTAL